MFNQNNSREWLLDICKYCRMKYKYRQLHICWLNEMFVTKNANQEIDYSRAKLDTVSVSLMQLLMPLTYITTAWFMIATST